MDNPQAFILRLLAKKTELRLEQIVVALPKSLAGDSALRTVEAALSELRSAGKVRFHNNKYSLTPGVRP